MPILVWFRSDLRVRDNRALWHACAAARDGVVGVFLVSPAQWSDHGWGAPKVGFVVRSVASLSRELAGLNIPLKVLEVPRFEGAPAALLGLARGVGADRLCFSREYEVNERARDEAVCDAFEAGGLRVESFHDQAIVPVHDIRTKSGKFYTVFTPFRRAWEAVAEDRDLWAPVPAPPRQPELPIEPDEVPGSVAGFGGAPIDWDLWPAGESAACERLDAFVRARVDAYSERRDFPSADATSELSPYLAAGVISARTCVYAAGEHNRGRITSGHAGVVKWVQELVWRDFFRHVLIGFPRVCRGRAFKVDVDESVAWSSDERAFTAWREGRTGFPIVDAGMRQLAQTGWMHNRVRMIVAMFLTKDLLIDWRWGERHFMRSLVDADFASNNGGWQWSSSTGTDAAPYFRIQNPTTQGKRFDAGGAFVRAFVPELAGVDARSIHDPSAAQRAAVGYPVAMVDHARARERALAAFKRG